MEKLTVLLMCSSGMSSTILKKNMQTAAMELGIDLSVSAKAESAVNLERDIYPADIIMLAPQIRYIQEDIRIKSKGKPVEIISMQDYGLGNGKNVLHTCIEILER